MCVCVCVCVCVNVHANRSRFVRGGVSACVCRYCADNDIPVTVFTLAINYSDKPDFVALEYIPARHMEDSSSSSH